MLDWDDARYFLAIRRTASLTAAARGLGVNQSTVSRRLAVLEERLGARLFVRTPDGYVPSPAGERLERHAERMEEEAIAIEREVTGQATSLVGTVRMTAPDALGSAFLVPLLGELRARHPGIALELSAENRVFSLSKREADMALRVGKPAESLVVARHVADLGYALYASRAYVAAHGKPRGDDLAGHRFVAYDEPFATSTVDGRWIAARTANAMCALRTNSTHAQLHAVRAGIGVGVLPCYLADPDASLVRLRPPREVASERIWLVVHADLRHAARIRATADFLADAIAARRAELAGARPKSCPLPADLATAEDKGGLSPWSDRSRSPSSSPPPSSRSPGAPRNPPRRTPRWSSSRRRA